MTAASATFFDQPPGQDDEWLEEVNRAARQIRHTVLNLTLERDGCYLSQALSSAEIFATLYGRTLQLQPVDAPLQPEPFLGVPGDPEGESPSGGRFHGNVGPQWDRLMISPAHYAVAVYSALEAAGRLAPGALDDFNIDGSTLEMIGAEHSPGFELTTGSFGQALSQAAGIAWARRRLKHSGRVFVFMSDGEAEEGQTWEAAQAAAFYELGNLVVAMDVNGQQVDGWTKDVMNVEPLNERFAAFGWNVHTVDGHDPLSLATAFADKKSRQPTIVLAYTDSARGVPYLESRKPHLHYVRPRTPADVDALAEAMKGLAAQ